MGRERLWANGFIGEGGHDPVVIRGVEPLGVGTSTDDLAILRMHRGQRPLAKEEIVDPAIRESDFMGLNEWILVVPRDSGFLRVQMRKKIHESRRGQFLNGGMLRLSVQVTGDHDFVCQSLDHSKELIDLAQARGDILRFPGKVRCDDP